MFVEQRHFSRKRNSERVIGNETGDSEDDKLLCLKRRESDGN